MENNLSVGQLVRVASGRTLMAILKALETGTRRPVMKKTFNKIKVKKTFIVVMPTNSICLHENPKKQRKLHRVGKKRKHLCRTDWGGGFNV